MYESAKTRDCYDTHISYDALQYPLMFPRGEVSQVRVRLDYNLMIFLRGEDRYSINISQAQSGTSIKITNLKKLRVDHYIHLKDAIADWRHNTNWRFSSN